MAIKVIYSLSSISLSLDQHCQHGLCRLQESGLLLEEHHRKSHTIRLPSLSGYHQAISYKLQEDCKLQFVSYNPPTLKKRSILPAN